MPQALQDNIYYYLFYAFIALLFIVVLKLPKKEKEDKEKKKFVSTSKKFTTQSTQAENKKKDS